MEPNTTKTGALDFFLHLGSIVALYFVIGNFINLLFRVIDKAFPEIITNAYYWSQGSEISFPVASLIVVFPIFIVLSKLVHKTYNTDPNKKHLAIRKWLTYITLFFAGIFLAGDLVTVLYKFLDGQNLTATFLLKALSVFVVSGAVFGFYLQDIRERISARAYRVWAIVVGVLILVAIILGFSVLGSPRTQRLLREDNLTINDLYSIEQEVINYWMTKGLVPEAIPQNIYLAKNLEDYTYKKTGNLSFELCANFNLTNSGQGRRQGMVDTPMWGRKMMAGNGPWNHEAGYNCFERLIDPTLYPTQVRG